MAWYLRNISASTDVTCSSAKQYHRLDGLNGYRVSIENSVAGRAYTINTEVGVREDTTTRLLGYVRSREIIRDSIILDVVEYAVRLFDSYVEWSEFGEEGGFYIYGGGGSGGQGNVIMATAPADSIILDVLGAVICEDGMADHWSTVEGGGAGAFTITESDDSATKQTGTDSMKIVVGAGAYTTVYVTTSLTATDITDYTNIYLWLKGANTGDIDHFYLLEGADWAYWCITDNNAAFRRITLSVASPNANSGGWTGTAVTGVRFYPGCTACGNFATNSQGTWHLDRIWFEGEFNLGTCSSRELTVHFEDKTKYQAIKDIATALNRDLSFNASKIHLHKKGSTVGALTRYRVLRRTDSDDFANYIIARSVDHNGAPITATASNASSIAAYGQMEKIIEIPEAFDSTTLAYYARRELENSKREIKATLVMPSADVTTLAVGDQIPVTDAAHQMSGNFRVINLKRGDDVTIIEVVKSVGSTRDAKYLGTSSLAEAREKSSQARSTRMREHYRSATYVVADDGSGQFRKAKQAVEKLR